MGFEHSMGADELRLGSVSAREEIRQLSVLEVRRLVWEGVALVDARTAAEFDHAQLKGAIHLGPEASDLELRAAISDRQQPLICYSNRTGRASQLVQRLQQLHYAHVFVLANGLEGFLAQQDS
jgi:rhodanese-related sulfurtransferase